MYSTFTLDDILAEMEKDELAVKIVIIAPAEIDDQLPQQNEFIDNIPKCLIELEF